MLLCIFALTANDTDKTHFSPYGLAQYRFRLDFLRVTPVNGNSVSEMDYSNRIAFYLGLQAELNHNISMQFQFGNDWMNTESVTFLTNNPATVTSRSFPPFSFSYFHLAYVRWEPGRFSLSAGIVPLLNFGPLDLLERSLATGRYDGASQVSWAVGTNNSLMGASAGIRLLAHPLQLKFNLFSTILEPRRQMLVVENEITQNVVDNPSSILFVCDIPLVYGPFSFSPQGLLILSRNYNQARDESDHEIGGGFTTTYQSGRVSAMLFGGYSRLTNHNSGNPVDSFTVAQPLVVPVYDFRGLISGVIITVPIGNGNAIADIRYSYALDKDTVQSLAQYLYFDFKYGWTPNSFITIMPRFRIFSSFFTASSTLKRNVTVRPELILTGTF